MITLENDALVFSFPAIHRRAKLRVSLQRTLRIPDDNREYPLPPGLGSFPLRHVDDYGAKVPRQWREHGGVFLPMYQAEALWIYFFSGDYPFSVKIAAGKVNAVTGDPWTEGLSSTPQDYLVAPDQPWLDGFCVARGRVRQFVAMPLGQGYTAEEQLTGGAAHGGIQIAAFPMKADLYEEMAASRLRRFSRSFRQEALACDMGLAAGGVMRQKLFEDRYGLKAWELSATSRCFVHIANSLSYTAITGVAPPTEPPSAKDYTQAALPWFDYYAGDLAALAGSQKLAGLDSVAVLGVKKAEQPLPENSPVEPVRVIGLRPGPSVVREGAF